MAFSYNEDEDAKADELPSDEEGDDTKPAAQAPPLQSNGSKVPKIPPPCNVQLQLTNPQSISPQKSLSPASNTSNASNENANSPEIDTTNIMAYGPNMSMRVHSKHRASKSLNYVDMPQFWACEICTFAGNSLASPVCGICGALPPKERPQRKTLRNRKKAAQNNGDRKRNAISNRANQAKHHQHDSWLNLQTRQRHNNHQTHMRTVSEQKAVSGNSNISQLQILPHFLEEDEQKDDDQQPSYMKKNSIANLVTRNNAISVINEIPQQEKDLIIKQINRISSKKELQIELYSVKMSLQKKIKLHKTRIIALNKQKSKLKSEYLIQSSLWKKYGIILLSKLCEGYFKKLFSLIDIRISVENLYLQCFELKLEKVHTAYNRLDFTIDDWDINDTREYVKSTMFTISKIRTSPDVHKKKKDIERLKLSISKMEKKYEEKKELLNKSKVDNKKRTAYITLYLKQVIDEFNANNKNIKLTETFFCAKAVQENFNSFLLDQRVAVGEIVNDWLDFLSERKKHEKEILFKDIYIFTERLINTFCKLYNLEGVYHINRKYNYKEYCKRFIYSAVLNLEVVAQILGKIADSEQGRKEYKLLSAHAQYTLFAHFLRLKYGF